MMATRQAVVDPMAQLRALYADLLRNQDHFDEFKHLLALYHPDGVDQDGNETPTAREVRARLNDRIRAWLGAPMDEMTPDQVLQWRAIVVEQRFGQGRHSHGSGVF